MTAHPTWRRRLRNASAILMGSLLCGLLMELPSLDPTAANPYHTGAVLSLLMSVGLLSWALRATRSNNSRFTLRTLLTITAVVAVGFVNVFLASIVV